MSRSWFFFGLIAFATAASFAGCTITTDTDGGLGGAGGDAFGGSAGEGGSGGNGGASDQGGTDQGGTSSEGGSSNQGGQSQGGSGGQGTTVTFDDAVAAACAISAMSDCIGNTPPCVEYYTTANSDWPNCEGAYIEYFQCVANVPETDIKCQSATPIVPACDTEENAWIDCTIP